jgi:hypothetical protein
VILASTPKARFAASASCRRPRSSTAIFPQRKVASAAGKRGGKRARTGPARSPSTHRDEGAPVSSASCTRRTSSCVGDGRGDRLGSLGLCRRTR